MVVRKTTEQVCDLNHLRAFERAAALGTHQAASRALRTNSRSVRRSVRLLEEFLGVALVQRPGVNVVMTEAGEALYKRVASHLKAIDRAITLTA